MSNVSLDRISRYLLKQAHAAVNEDDHGKIVVICEALASIMEQEFSANGELPAEAPENRKLNPRDPDVADEIALSQASLTEVCEKTLAAIRADTNPKSRGAQIKFLYGLWMQKCTLRSKVIRFGHKAFLNLVKYIARAEELFNEKG